MKSISFNRKYLACFMALFISFHFIGCKQEVEKKIDISKFSNDQISLAVIIKATEGNEEIVKNACLSLLEPTRKEKGCINYTLHIDPNDNSRFMFYENWENVELWEAHLNTPHIKKFGKETNGLLAENLDVTNWKIY